MRTKPMKLLYVMDPLCGWCYGNARTIERLADAFSSAYEFEILPGGMITAPNTRTQTTSFRNYVVAADRRITEMTGAEFGEAYVDSLNDASLLLDSEPPSRAIVAVKAIKPESALRAASAIQRARFVEGKDLNNEESYRSVCGSADVEWNEFTAAFRSESIRLTTQQAFARARKRTSGFPTLLLDHGDSACVLAHGYASYEHVASKLESLVAG